MRRAGGPNSKTNGEGAEAGHERHAQHEKAEDRPKTRPRGTGLERGPWSATIIQNPRFVPRQRLVMAEPLYKTCCGFCTRRACNCGPKAVGSPLAVVPDGPRPSGAVGDGIAKKVNPRRRKGRTDKNRQPPQRSEHERGGKCGAAERGGCRRSPNDHSCTSPKTRGARRDRAGPGGRGQLRKSTACLLTGCVPVVYNRRRRWYE